MNVDERFGTPAGPLLAAALERLDRLVDWERRDRSGPHGQRMRVDTAAVRDVLERLGHPERRLRAVHVAGSKGKGSVAALVAAGLERAGRRTGVYASPHVSHLVERVSIGGRWIGEQELASALGRSLDARDAAAAEGSAGDAATWFDVLTAGAFVALADAEVDWAVVECGLGGRLDSTNVLAAELCVLTNVHLEHTAILGGTRAEIASEKAGIVHPGACVVCGHGPGDEAGAVWARVAAEHGARHVVVAGAEKGTIEERNRALARAALDQLVPLGVEGGGAWLDGATAQAARLPGRLERREYDGVTVVLDGAHVPASLEALLAALELPGDPVVVLGVGRDKDARGLLKVLSGRADRVLCTSVGDGPYAESGALHTWAREAGLAAETAATPRMALERALEASRPTGWVLVTGSLHLVGAVRRELDGPTTRC